MRRQIGTCLAVFAGVACHSGTEPPPPDPPETIRNEIVFSSNRDGRWQLRRMDPDGGNLRPIPGAIASGAAELDVSPNGEWVVLSDGEDIWRFRVDGSEPRQLTNDPGFDRAPVWSPDGTRIAFSSNRVGPQGSGVSIFLMNADGSNVAQITTAPTRDDQPSWSPDGSALTFFSKRDGNDEIYVVRLDGSPPVNVSNYVDSDINPEWSPDGRTIAFPVSFAANHLCLWGST